jgi:tetratricopeptide (TPR) repeat protein
MSRTELARRIVETGRRMGEHVGCTARLVASWEDGEVACPQAVYRRILTKITGRTAAELGFVPASPALAVVRDPDQHQEDQDVNRRAFLGDATGVALALMPGETQRVGRLGARDVHAVTRAVETVYAHDHEHGSASLRTATADALNTAYAWLQEGTYTEVVGTGLRSATGHLSIAAGWLSYDSGRPADARSYYGEALAAARIAVDPMLEGHAYLCLSDLARASGRPREAISAAQAAQSVIAHRGSFRMLSLAAVREARGWAAMGDAAATDRALVRAHHLYARGPSGADPEWLEFFSPGELTGLESLARADLAQHDRASAGAEQAVLLNGEAFQRNRALYTADVAIYQAVRHRPDPEAAAEAAGRALAYLPAVRSDRLLTQLHSVESALQRHCRVPAVAAWLEQYRTVTTA